MLAVEKGQKREIIEVKGTDGGSPLLSQYSTNICLI